MFPHKSAHAINNLGALALVKKRVIRGGENMHALYRRRETVEEFALRLDADDPIAAGRKHESRDVNRAGVSEEPRSGIVQPDKHVHRDLPEDQRVGVVLRCLHGIVRQHLRFHVALHVTGSDEFLFEAKRRNRERNVEADAERGRGQNHGANRRRVIVDPRRDRHRADAMREHDHIFEREPLIVADVACERVDVFHQRAEILGRAALAGRTSVATRVPGEDRDVVKAEHLHEFRPAPGMFVAAMEKQQRFLRAPFRDPGAIKELGAIPA